jgi:putative addiction module killer protein
LLPAKICSIFRPPSKLTYIANFPRFSAFSLHFRNVRTSICAYSEFANFIEYAALRVVKFLSDQMEPQTLEILYYQKANGDKPFELWEKSQPDPLIRAKCSSRLRRLEQGNFGSFKREGNIIELKDKGGAGYRIYLGMDGARLVILLCGGNKNTQDQDWENARKYWEDYCRRR